MGTHYFQFKQFTIYHDRCAMKVGTDGVLLGAWCNIPKNGNILDIGTGTGIIALMAAQRSSFSQVSIDAIEIDRDAYLQAKENISSSPWSNKIQVINCSLQEYAKCQKLSMIILCLILLILIILCLPKVSLGKWHDIQLH